MSQLSISDAVSLLMGKLDGGKDVRTYLKQFSSRQNGCFAIVKIGGALVESQRDKIAKYLALIQSLDLSPIVVFGAGQQIDAKCTAQGIPQEKVDGLRVTSPRVLHNIAEITSDVSMSLVNAIHKFGGKAMSVSPVLVHAQLMDEARYGRVGSVNSVNKDQILNTMRLGYIPIFSCLAQDDLGGLLNVNADRIAGALAEALTPQKIIFLTPTGGLLGEDGALISAINLKSDYQHLINSDWLHSGMLVKIKEIKTLLDGLPAQCSISITSPDGLIRELFTHGGDGTLIRKGEAIVHSADFDQARMTRLLESAFAKTLNTDFWPAMVGTEAIYTENYRAAALMSSVESFTVLDKFVVHPDARGEGLAKAVWSKLEARYPKFLWRSRTHNPINDFYKANSDGFVKINDWLVYWRGYPLSNAVIDFAQDLANKPPDLE